MSWFGWNTQANAGAAEDESADSSRNQTVETWAIGNKASRPAGSKSNPKAPMPMALPSSSTNRRAMDADSEASSPTISPRPQASMPTSPRGQVDAVSRGGDVPMPKTAARKALPAWEEPWDSDEEQAESRRRKEERKGGYNVWSDEGATKRSFFSSSRGSDSTVPAPEPANVPLEPLASYEERVLNLAKPSDGPLSPAGISRPTSPQASPKAAGQGHPAAELQEDSAERRRPFVAAAKEGLECHEVLTSLAWKMESKHSKWTAGHAHGILDADDDEDALAVYFMSKTKLAHFDLEAKIMILEGNSAGLLFSCHGAGRHCVLRLDVKEQKVHLERHYGAHTRCDAADDAVQVKRDHWHHLRVRFACGRRTCWLDGRQLRLPAMMPQREEGATEQPCDKGFMGFYVEKQGSAQICDVSLTDLQPFADKIDQQHLMVEEQQQKVMEEEHSKTQRTKQLVNATRLVQQVMRINLSTNRQRMARYKQAQDMGTEKATRANELMAWLTLLSFFQKLDDTMRESEYGAGASSIWDRAQQKYLRKLDSAAPPPPPPPHEDPPDEFDEQLAYKYDQKRNFHAHRWESAGRQHLGKEKFEEVRRSEHGLADKHKRAIAQKCYQQAMAATSEKEHIEFLQKAWRLENNFNPLEAVDVDEVKRWATEYGARLTSL